MFNTSHAASVCSDPAVDLESDAGSDDSGKDAPEAACDSDVTEAGSLFSDPLDPPPAGDNAECCQIEGDDNFHENVRDGSETDSSSQSVSILHYPRRRPVYAELWAQNCSDSDATVAGSLDLFSDPLDPPAVEIAECCQSEDDVASVGDDTDTDSSSKSVSILQYTRKRIQ